MKYRIVFVIGFILVAIGFIGVAWTVFRIGLDMSLCNSGLGPVPGQGCTYVPYLVLYVWNGFQQYLIIGTLALFLGIILLAVYGWNAYMHPIRVKAENQT